MSTRTTIILLALLLVPSIAAEDDDSNQGVSCICHCKPLNTDDSRFEKLTIASESGGKGRSERVGGFGEIFSVDIAKLVTALRPTPGKAVSRYESLVQSYIALRCIDCELACEIRAKVMEQLQKL